MDMTSLLMRRAAWISAACFSVVLALAAARAQLDIRQESQGADQVARLVGELAALQSVDRQALDQQVDKLLNATEGNNLIKERWIIQNAEVMRLIVTGAGVRWDALYRDGRRLASAVDASSPETKASNISHEFLEPFLYIRSSAKFFDYFIKNKILPPSAAKPTARIANINTYKPVPEAAVRLGREGGAIAWVFGEATPVGSAIQYPGAWIE